MNIYDIAERAGVSIATVSRVINGNGPVSAQTTKKVLKVIDELGYRPNVFAQGLNTNSMRTIGVLTTNICDLYYATAIHTIEQNAKKSGYDVLLSCTTSGVEDKKKHIGLLLEKRVDGLILIGSIFRETSNNTHILEAAKSVPVVLLNSCVEGKGVYSVYCEDDAGARMAAGHLIAGGRRHIAYINDVTTYSGRNKLEGYHLAMEQAGLAPDVVTVPPGIDGGWQAAEQLLSRTILPDGIACSEDELAAGVLKKLAQAGVRVPDDVAVVGYNDSLLARCTTPELASVNSKVRELSAYALETMVKCIETGMAPQKTAVTPELVVRESARLH